MINRFFIAFCPCILNIYGRLVRCNVSTDRTRNICRLSPCYLSAFYTFNICSLLEAMLCPSNQVVWLITASDYIWPHRVTSDQIWLNCPETSATAMHCLYTSSKRHTGAWSKMFYIYDVRGKPFVSCSGCPNRWESPQWTTKPLTRSFTVLLTLGDTYATDDLGLILFMGGLTCSELTACQVACLPWR